MGIYSTRYNFTHNNNLSKDYILVSDATRVGAEKLKRPGRYYRVVMDEGVGIKRTWFEALERARHLLKVFPVGHVIIMRAFGSDDSFLDQVRFRKAERLPSVPDGPGVEGIDRFVAHVNANYKRARFAGSCVCKPNSDHRDCAAVDYFDTKANMELMLADALEFAWYFHTKYAILFDRIYFVRDDGTYYSEHYSGQYHSHIHVSVNGGKVGSAC